MFIFLKSLTFICYLMLYKLVETSGLTAESCLELIWALCMDRNLATPTDHCYTNSGTKWCHQCKIAALVSGIVSFLSNGRKCKQIVHLYLGQWRTKIKTENTGNNHSDVFRLTISDTEQYFLMGSVTATRSRSSEWNVLNQNNIVHRKLESLVIKQILP